MVWTVVIKGNTPYILQNTDVEIVAIVNDAVGTLMSTAHADRACEIGLILGKCLGIATLT